jgi:hypothetical protein
MPVLDETPKISTPSYLIVNSYYTSNKNEGKEKIVALANCRINVYFFIIWAMITQV